MRNTGNHLQIYVNQRSVAYTDVGPLDKPVILFLHGFPLDRTLWDRQVEALLTTHRVIAYDIRGHGGSDIGSEPVSIRTFANDLIDFMGELKLDDIILCGLSMGGYIALDARCRFPKRFKALILCDTQCSADTPESKDNRIRTMDRLSEDGLEAYTEESLANLFAEASFNTHPEDVEQVRNMIRNTTILSLKLSMRALSDRSDACESLREIDVPTLIIVGSEDKITPPAKAEIMHERISGSELIVIDGAGHLPNLESTDDFNTHLIRFVSSFN